ncbi:MAG: GyrI-like domain-containing protein [Chloroflexi bacterium]|nr:GyrI-like domain-containing protein [Chloroflexota bacterium]
MTQQEFQFEVTTWDARPTVFIRTRCPIEQLPTKIGEAYGQIMPYLAQQGVEPVEPPYVAYHDPDMSNLDVEIGQVIAQAVPSQGDIQAGTLPAGQAAACIYKGAYDGISAAHDALAGWAKAQGHTSSGVAYEFYISDPGDTPPQDLLTRVVHPLSSG